MTRSVQCCMPLADTNSSDAELLGVVVLRALFHAGWRTRRFCFAWGVVVPVDTLMYWTPLDGAAVVGHGCYPDVCHPMCHVPSMCRWLGSVVLMPGLLVLPVGIATAGVGCASGVVAGGMICTRVDADADNGGVVAGTRVGAGGVVRVARVGYAVWVGTVVAFADIVADSVAVVVWDGHIAAVARLSLLPCLCFCLFQPCADWHMVVCGYLCDPASLSFWPHHAVKGVVGIGCPDAALYFVLGCDRAVVVVVAAGPGEPALALEP